MTCKTKLQRSTILQHLYGLISRHLTRKRNVGRLVSWSITSRSSSTRPATMALKVLKPSLLSACLMGGRSPSCKTNTITACSSRRVRLTTCALSSLTCCRQSPNADPNDAVLMAAASLLAIRRHLPQLKVSRGPFEQIARVDSTPLPTRRN